MGHYKYNKLTQNKKTIVLAIAICWFETLSLAQSATKDCSKLESENK